MNIFRRIRRHLHLNHYIQSHKLKPLFTREPATEAEAAQAERRQHSLQFICTDCGKVVLVRPDGSTSAMYDQDTIDYAKNWNARKTWDSTTKK